MNIFTHAAINLIDFQRQWLAGVAFRPAVPLESTNAIYNACNALSKVGSYRGTEKQDGSEGQEGGKEIIRRHGRTKKEAKGGEGKDKDRDMDMVAQLASSAAALAIPYSSSIPLFFDPLSRGISLGTGHNNTGISFCY